MAGRIADQFSRYQVDENGCWLWLGHIDRGYGYMTLNGKQARAHRVFYEHHIAPIPAGMLVCHRCDVRRCVNPAHLFLGTNKDNMDDRDRKGRLKLAPMGERHNHAKLTEAQVLEARERWGRRELSKRALAMAYGVTCATMRALLNGRNWKNVGGLNDTGK